VATLFRRNNGVWYLVHQDGRRRRWLSTGEKCLGRALTFVKLNRPVTQRARGVTVTSFAGEIVEYSRRNHSIGTTSIYATTFARLVELVGDKRLASVTVLDAEEFKKQRIVTVSRVTVNKEVRTLRSAFRLACEWGYIDKNPFAISRLLKVPYHEPPHMTQEDFAKLLVAIDDPAFRNVVLVAVCTMMRRSEVINLRWDDVDLAKREIHIRSRGDFTVKGNRPRRIPLCDVALQTLSGMRGRSGWVFPGTAADRMVAGSLSRRFRKYVLRAGLSDKLHFHSLRHTGASWLVQRGVSLFVVQKILGHSSPTVTQIYSHLSDQSLQRAVQELGPLLPHQPHAALDGICLN
jgi:integrase